MLVSDEPLAIPGLRQRIAVAPENTELAVGTGLIYIAMFLCCKPQLRAAHMKQEGQNYLFGGRWVSHIALPIDIDAHIITVKMAVSVDGVGGKALPNYRSV